VDVIFLYIFLTGNSCETNKLNISFYFTFSTLILIEKMRFQTLCKKKDFNGRLYRQIETMSNSNKTPKK